MACVRHAFTAAYALCNNPNAWLMDIFFLRFWLDSIPVIHAPTNQRTISIIYLSLRRRFLRSRLWWRRLSSSSESVDSESDDELDEEW